MNVSVLILTLNEEINLKRCLESLNWTEDIVVLDSYSSDQTKEITESANARFIQRYFDDYASQRNFGLNEIPYKNDWLLMVDADEVVPTNLFTEIRETLSNKSNEATLYRLRRKDYFWGKWIKRSSGYPTWFGRLMKIGQVRVKRSINEEYVTDGEIGYLEAHLHHYPFNKGIKAWLEKHNRYSSMEAEVLFNNSSTRSKLSNIFSNDPSVRRKAQKAFVYRLPGRPILMFFALYIFRGGFLDGTAGLTCCTLRAIYEYMINLKVRELRQRQKNLPV